MLRGITKIIPELRHWLSSSEWMLAQAEIAQLPNILWDDEYPDYVAQGVYSGGVCLIVPTNLRLILIDKKFFNLKVDGFSYNRIDTIEYDRGLIFGWMNVMLPGRAVELRYLRRDSIAKLCESINEHVTRHHNYVSQSINTQVLATVEPEPDQVDHTLEQLERLDSLKQSGMLTEIEFSQQKSRVLHGPSQNRPLLEDGLVNQPTTLKNGDDFGQSLS